MRENFSYRNLLPLETSPVAAVTQHSPAPHLTRRNSRRMQEKRILFSAKLLSSGYA
jgi:hypothetical protein